MLQRIAIEDFAQEIRADLPELLNEFECLMYSSLQEYYGETFARVKLACNILERQGVIQLRQTASRAYIIEPIILKGIRIQLHPDLKVLTPLQRSLTTTIVQLCGNQNTDTCRTNYAQLSRITHCSYGGIRACMSRLIELGYFEIVTKGKRGKQDVMVIKLTPKTENLKNV